MLALLGGVVNPLGHGRADPLWTARGDDDGEQQVRGHGGSLADVAAMVVVSVLSAVGELHGKVKVGLAEHLLNGLQVIA